MCVCFNLTSVCARCISPRVACPRLSASCPATTFYLGLLSSPSFYVLSSNYNYTNHYRIIMFDVSLVILFTHTISKLILLAMSDIEF